MLRRCQVQASQAAAGVLEELLKSIHLKLRKLHMGVKFVSAGV
jgi:hypothetical protein